MLKWIALVVMILMFIQWGCLGVNHYRAFQVYKQHPSPRNRDAVQAALSQYVWWGGVTGCVGLVFIVLLGFSSL